MDNRIKGLILGLGLCLMIGLAGGPAQADVDVNINVGVPPVVLAGPPTMLFLVEPGVYVAVGTSYDIFFLSSRYYYFYAGNWYWGPEFDGPWIRVQYKAMPPGLRKYKIRQLQTFREREFKVYKAQGPKYKGKKFVGARGPAKPDKGPMKELHMKEDRGGGGGKGHKK